jgi:hypothetical protein
LAKGAGGAITNLFPCRCHFLQGEIGDFYIQNDLLSPSLGGFIFFVHQWHMMPLFFLIAGSASWFVLELRTPMQYVSDRFLCCAMEFGNHRKVFDY